MLAADSSAWSLKLTVRDGIGREAERLAVLGVIGASPAAGCRAFLLTLAARDGVGAGAGPPLASVRSLLGAKIDAKSTVHTSG